MAMTLSQHVAEDCSQRLADGCLFAERFIVPGTSMNHDAVVAGDRFDRDSSGRPGIHMSDIESDLPEAMVYRPLNLFSGHGRAASADCNNWADAFDRRKRLGWADRSRFLP